MKKQNQAPGKKAKTTPKAAQQKPSRLRDLALAVIKASPDQLRLLDLQLDAIIRLDPRTLPRRDRRVHTGSLVWEEAEFEAARRDGRFILVDLTKTQSGKLARVGRWTFVDFLPFASDSQLIALSGTAPLYWAIFPQNERVPRLTALRGPGPGGINTPEMTRFRRVIAAEIRRRKRSRK